ncbi:MAG: hypothetical protein ACI870_000339 [Crocinitomicaceae bacterium]|jgi:hypothetical protein
MISTKKYYDKFLESKFKDVRITPTEWNDKIFWVNCWHVLIKTGFTASIAAISSFVILGLLSLVLVVIADTEIPYLGSIVLACTIAGLIIGLFDLSKMSEFIKVDEGYYALISLNGSLQGEFYGHGATGKRKDYHLTDGSFRNIIRLPFSPICFDTDPIPIELPPYDDFIYENVRASDGVAFNGTDSALPLVHDPWTFIRLIKSAGKAALESRIREISLEALNKAYDDIDSGKIMSKDGSGDLIDAYADALDDNTECSTAGSMFYNKKKLDGDTVFCIEGTGLSVRFLIKTSVPPDGIQKSYNDLRGATINKGATIINAEAEAEAKSILDLRLSENLATVTQMFIDKKVPKGEAASLAAAALDIFGQEIFIKTSGTGKNGDSLNDSIRQMAAAWLAKK